jgi:hypothetical protein
MHSILICVITFSVVFGSALLGIFLRSVIPDEHLSSDSKDTIKLATGLVITMTALVLGMLVSSAKASYDSHKAEVASMATKIVLLDRQLVHFGPDAELLRHQLRESARIALERVWTSRRLRPVDLAPMEAVGLLYDEVDDLPATTERQQATKAKIVSLASDLKETRMLIFIQSGNDAVSLPLLAVVVSWLAAIFLSFGVFSPPNRTVLITLLFCAVAVSGAIFIILEMYSPFSGVLRISPQPLYDALGQLGK